jgi:type I restriction-modification system DNA methylase subunit
MNVPPAILDRVARFEQQLDAYKSGSYNETQLRRDFLDPCFKLLGWDMDNEAGYAEAYRDVIHEDAIRIGGAVKAPDYCFRIGGTRKFFLEAKKPSVFIKQEIPPAYQLRRYGWNAKLALSILSDFEELAVYDCRVKPGKDDPASTARVFYCTFRELAEKWDWFASIFSRDAVLKGSFDKFAETNKTKRGTTEVDADFLASMETWRNDLAKNLALRNPRLSQRELNFAVQRILDRIIFLRICEDRGLEDYGRLLALTNAGRIYPRLCQHFEQADTRYNSGIFHFKPEKDRHEPPDELTLGLEVDDTLLRDLLKGLYYPDSPYEFSLISADILGQVYEQFLGKVIRLTESHRAVVDEKPEVRKAGGVYYTPTYIADYIVRQTVGRLVEEIVAKETGRAGAPTFGVPASAGNASASSGALESTSTRPAEAGTPNLSVRAAQRVLDHVAQLRILDPACGSGSFLICAYQFLLDWHLQFYLANNPEKWAKGKQPAIIQTTGGWRLTIAERKRILLNNIYGVDIDPQAVEVTKLSLLLKVLEGETSQSIAPLFSIFHERALPDLGDNIKCGNSLIGPDFYNEVGRDVPSAPSPDDARSGAVRTPRPTSKGQQLPLFQLTDDEKLRLNVFDWHAEFPHIFRRRNLTGELHEPAAAAPLDYTMPGVPLHGSYSCKKKKIEKTVPPPTPIESEWEGGFDAVIGNPPWGASFADGELQYLRTKYSEVVVRMVDSYIYFIARATTVTKDEAPIGFIIPSTILNQSDSRPVREALLKRGVSQVISLGQGIFGSKVLNTSTILITGNPISGRLVISDLSKFPLVERAQQLRSPQLVGRDTWLKLVEQDTHKTFFTGDSSAPSLLARLRNEHLPLSDILIAGIARGVSPDVAAAHVLTLAEAKRLRLEKDILRPSVSGSQIKRYREWRVDQVIIYTARDTDITAYPRTKQHLDSFRSQNTCREVKEGKHPFWSLHRPRDPLIFASPKFVGITTAKRIELIYDPDQSVFVTDAMYLFSTKKGYDPFAVLAVLQSRLFLFLYRVANEGEARVIPQVKASKLEPLPFPKAMQQSQLVPILAEKSQSMFHLSRQLASARTPHEQTALERQIAATDTQIDQLVYALYGLTEEEIKIVEGVAK